MAERESATISLFSSIRTRLILAFVLIALLPMAVISAVLAVSGSKGAQAQFLTQLETVASLKDTALNTWASTLKAELGNGLIGENTLQLVSALVEKTPDSREHQTARSVLLGRFRQFMARTQLFEEMFLMDRKGRVALSTEAVREGRTYSGQVFFERGLKGPVVHPSSSGRIAIIAARPIVDDSGRVLGVLAGRVGMGRFTEIMRVPTGLGKTGMTYLVDAQYTLLTPLPGIEPGSKVDSYEIREVVEKKTEGSGAYKDFRGVPVIGAYRWLPELEVALMAEQEQSESARSVSVMLAVNASVALAALLIATIASLAVTRGIASPLAELSDAAAQIAVGNLSITAEVQRKDEIGALAGTFNFMTDELRRTMTGLRKSEEKYRTLVDNVNIGIYRNTGGQGMFLQANPALAKIFGYDTVEELRQVAVADLYVDPEDRERFLEEVKRSGFVKDRKLALKKKDGTPIWCSVSATVQYGEYGEMEWMDGVLEDVTERKRAEEERERLLHDLTEAVATAKTLSGMLPICASCKRIRDDKGYWQQIEAYVSEHSEAEFSHGVCPECFKKLYPGYSMENLKTDKKDTA